MLNSPSQRGGDGECAVAYFSRTPSWPEKNYCVTHHGLLAVVLALWQFRPYLHGSRFLLCTVHASLTWLMNFKNPEGQVARWLEALQRYDFKIQHRALYSTRVLLLPAARGTGPDDVDGGDHPHHQQ